MAENFRKVMPVLPSSSRLDTIGDSINTEYSIALEYTGPPLSHDVPRALPIADDQIPIAPTVDPLILSKNSPIPVIQPIVKRNPVKKGESKKTKLNPEPRNCVVSLNGPRDRKNLGKNLDFNGGDNSSKDFGCSDELGSKAKFGSVVGLAGGSNERVDSGFKDYMNPGTSDSTGSVSSSRALSSEVFSCKEEGGNSEDTSPNVERPLAVTFIDPEGSGSVEEESSYSDADGVFTKPRAKRPGKKGTCYRCLKGNRFTEKEVCIVCGAKYCSNCVRRAMGSMPEGRKCVGCVRFRIDEGKRGSLGKCSRMLKRILTEEEVKQAMEFEVSCKANQLPPELVFVNDEVLSQTELYLLRSCPNPPKNLIQGAYWYDKVSGFWGKVGHGPCQIISPQLNVGGQIMRNASNGNTNVLINNREITKKELWMLQSAGEKCEGQPHFWVSADGSYQEEGQKNVKGRIWDKTRMKLVCAILSLPTPNSVNNPDAEANDSCFQQNTLRKMLLVGDIKSGTSTIYKHAKIIYKVPFAEDELENIKSIIQSNLYRYLGILLKGRQKFEEECLKERRKGQAIDQASPSMVNTGQTDEKTIYSINPRHKKFSDWLLKVMESGNLEAIFPAATREYAPFVEDLWKDAAVQATYNRRSELEMLPRNATYFLERAVDISRADYELSENDILYAEGITTSNGLSSMEFSFPESRQESPTKDSFCYNDPSLRYQLIRSHPSCLGDNCKWLERFEEIDLIVFCVSLTDYDEFFEDNDGILTNRMVASKQLFENIVTHESFKQKDFLLLLNKFDLLEEKIEQVPLMQCEWFNDFNPVISHNHRTRRSSTPSLAQRASHYIAMKFKRLFHFLTDRKLYVSMVTGLEPESVDEAFKYAREILKWEAVEFDYSMEISYTDCEVSSSS